MATCQITGHPDTYGVGIRTAFYLQWLGMAITSWLFESDALNLKFVNALTVAATSAGLITHLDELQPSEINVVLLLVCETLYSSVPLYAWRIATCCQPWWDPERWARLSTGWLFRASGAVLSSAVLGLQLWFWCAGVHNRPVTGVDSTIPGAGCAQYGFLLGQLPLDAPGLIAVNIVVHLAILLTSTWTLASYAGLFDGCRWHHERRRRWSISKDRTLSLQQFRTICDVGTAAVVTVAIELVISWNGIRGVNDLDSAAQLIPPVASGAYLARSVHIWLSGPHGGSGGPHIKRRTKRIVYIGPTGGHRRRSSRSHHHHHRSWRTSSASPTILDICPSLVGASPVSPFIFMSAAPADYTTLGQHDMAPPGGDELGDDLYGQDHVYDEPVPSMAHPAPPVDDSGSWAPEPPPTAASMHHGGTPCCSWVGDSFLGPDGEIYYPSALPCDYCSV